MAVLQIFEKRYLILIEYSDILSHSFFRDLRPFQIVSLIFSWPWSPCPQQIYRGEGVPDGESHFWGRRGGEGDEWSRNLRILMQTGKALTDHWVPQVKLPITVATILFKNDSDPFLLTYLLLQLLWFLLQKHSCSHQCHSARSTYTNLIKTVGCSRQAASGPSFTPLCKKTLVTILTSCFGFYFHRVSSFVTKAGDANIHPGGLFRRQYEFK